MVRVRLNLLMVGKVELPVTKRFGISPNRPPTFAVSWHCILTAGRKSVFSHVNQYISTRIFEIKKNFALFSAADETARPADRRKSFAILDRRDPMRARARGGRRSSSANGAVS